MYLIYRYSFVTKNRKKKLARKSGGIINITIYKNNNEKLLSKFLNSESEYVQWVELSALISSVNKNVLFGCVYVSHENSKYSSEEAFTEIENIHIGVPSIFEYFSINWRFQC